MQYQRLINIKPDYYELHSPYFMPTWYRFSANVKEFHLWFDEEFEVFRNVEVPQEESKKFYKKDFASKKRGGDIASPDEAQSSIRVLYYEDLGVFHDVEVPQEDFAGKKRGGDIASPDEAQSSIRVLYYEDFDISPSISSDS